MALIGYQASQEQFAPDHLLQLAIQAEKVGFQAVLSSDHVEPWSKTQGNSAFTWSWLGAAMQATKMQFGVVTVPGYRYHPVILAQAIATIDAMFPNRFFLTMGSGEALNEHIIGQKWPVKSIRNEILRESAEVMKKLWKGEEVTHHGHITVEEAKLYVKPHKVPKIYGAALTEPTAQWLGSWADGMITTSRPIPELKKMIDAFRKGGGKGKPIILKIQFSYDKTEKTALQGAYDQWRYLLHPTPLLADLKKAEHFDSASIQMSKETVKEQIKIATDLDELAEWIREYVNLGFERISLHNVNLNQEQYIKDFGKHVLPKLMK